MGLGLKDEEDSFPFVNENSNNSINSKMGKFGKKTIENTPQPIQIDNHKIDS